MNEFEHQCSKLLAAIDDVVKCDSSGLPWKERAEKLREMADNALDSTTTSWEEFTEWMAFLNKSE